MTPFLSGGCVVFRECYRKDQRYIKRRGFIANTCYVKNIRHCGGDPYIYMAGHFRTTLRLLLFFGFVFTCLRTIFSSWSRLCAVFLQLASNSGSAVSHGHDIGFGFGAIILALSQTLLASVSHRAISKID